MDGINNKFFALVQYLLIKYFWYNKDAEQSMHVQEQKELLIVQ